MAGEIENSSYQLSHGIRRNVSMEMKGETGLERSNFSDGGSPLENFGTPISQKSPVHEGIVVNSMTTPSGKPFCYPLPLIL